jgi:hypothetical protein
MKNNDLNPLNKEQFDTAVSLYRYVSWADLLRRQFETVITRNRQGLDPIPSNVAVAHEIPQLESEMYICLWFGVLYTAIEGWPTLKIDRPQIDELLRSPFKNLLRNFRNATIDSDEFDDDRIQAVFIKGTEYVDWARKVTLELKSLFESIVTTSWAEPSKIHGDL